MDFDIAPLPIAWMPDTIPRDLCDIFGEMIYSNAKQVAISMGLDYAECDLKGRHDIERQCDAISQMRWTKWRTICNDID